jgi:hypothetical protein
MTHEKWYDRNTRSWVVVTKDDKGNQVGDATYVYSKPEADRELKDRKKSLAESVIVVINEINSIREINTNTEEGRTLLVTLARLSSVPGYSARTPDDILKEMDALQKEVFSRNKS